MESRRVESRLGSNAVKMVEMARCDGVRDYRAASLVRAVRRFGQAEDVRVPSDDWGIGTLEFERELRCRWNVRAASPSIVVTRYVSSPRGSIGPRSGRTGRPGRARTSDNGVVAPNLHARTGRAPCSVSPHTGISLFLGRQQLTESPPGEPEPAMIAS